MVFKISDICTNANQTWYGIWYGNAFKVKKLPQIRHEFLTLIHLIHQTKSESFMYIYIDKHYILIVKKCYIHTLNDLGLKSYT